MRGDQDIKRSTESVWKLDAASADAPFDVVWEGALHIRQPGEYIFALDSDSPATVLLNDIVILSSEKDRGEDRAIGWPTCS